MAEVLEIRQITLTIRIGEFNCRGVYGRRQTGYIVSEQVIIIVMTMTTVGSPEVLA